MIDCMVLEFARVTVLRPTSIWYMDGTEYILMGWGYVCQASGPKIRFCYGLTVQLSRIPMFKKEEKV